MRVLAACCLVLLVSACTPSIKAISVGTGEPGESLPVLVEIDAGRTQIDSVTLEVRRVGDVDFTPMEILGGEAGDYRGSTARQAPGDYEARISVDYDRGRLLGVRTLKSELVRYQLGWPQGTFGFDTDGQGWQFNGVINHDAVLPTCGRRLTESIELDHIPTGWPQLRPKENAVYSGALSVTLSADCYPKQAAELAQPGSAYWGFELISPDLRGIDGWQSATGVRFRIRSEVPGLLAVILVRSAGGEVAQWVTPLLDDSPIFDAITPQWQTLQRKQMVSAGAGVQQILIRVFGEPSESAEFDQGRVSIDVVEPLSD
ncbi:MAG: hypothetical protein AAGA84_05455 [Pseudomonadota bacterium]